MKLNNKINRIISELKSGDLIVIHDHLDDVSVILSSSEIVNSSTVKNHKQLSLSQPTLILSSNRCNSIGIKTSKNCSCIIDDNWSKEDILKLTFAKKEDIELKINGLIQEKSNITNFCLSLLKKAKLLPCAIMSIVSNIDSNNIKKWAMKNDLMYLDVDDIEFKSEVKNDDLEIIVKTHLPIKETNDCDFVLFRSKSNLSEYFCLLIGKTRALLNDQKLNFVPTVRIHSQCLTGDLLDSLKCDCGEQLKMSLKHMVKNGEGILIYLSQEGRNIGLINKLRAYNLQEKGLDTVDANITLGFDEDERNYDIAVEILKFFEINKINFITNNPNKINYLEENGIKSKKRIASIVKSNQFNIKYLNTKKLKGGHFM